MLTIQFVEKHICSFLLAFAFCCLLPSPAGAQFVQQGNKLVGTGAVGSARQGLSVSVSADGNTAIVGGSYDNSTAGSAWVYTRSAGVWTQQGNKLVGSGAVGNAMQGRVSVSADGNTAIVGGSDDNSGAGAAWVYTRSAGVWTQQGSKLVGTGAVGFARQGVSVSLSADGNTAIVGGTFDNNQVGAAWVYTRSDTVWTQQGSKLVGTGAVVNSLQGSVSVSADGNTAIVGGYGDNGGAGAAWVYTRSAGVWTQQGSKLVGTDASTVAYQGNSVSVSADGNTAIVGGYGDEAAWVYTRSAGVWTQQGSKLVGTGAVGNAGQGLSVSVSANGNMAIVGGNSDNGGAGAAWVYTRSAGVWAQQGSKLVGTGAVGNAGQGLSVSVSADGNTAIVGGYGDNGAAGAAWVYYKETAAVISPKAGQLFRAGGTDSIRWTGGKAGKFLTIELSVNSGLTYTNIDIAIPADAGFYVWNIPDSLLSNRAKIRLSDAEDQSVLAVSDTFRIKGYVLTRFDSAGQYEAFKPNIHGWNYLNGTLWPANWWSQFNYNGIDPITNSTYEDFFDFIPNSVFVDWPLWVNVFSEDSCYWSTTFNIYRERAEEKWRRRANVHGGSCFGFAASSFLAFYYKDQFLARHPEIPNFASLFSLPINDEIRSTINGYFAYQFGKQSLDNDVLGMTKDARTTLSNLKTMFIAIDVIGLRTISIFNNGGAGSGGHTMAPIRLTKDDSGPSRYRLYVYDSNNPGSDMTYILIDSVNNTWAFPDLGPTWKGATHFYLEIPVSAYLKTPIFGKIDVRSIDNIKASSNIEFYNTSKANVMYTASNGNRIGLVNGIITDEIGDGIAIFDKNGRPSDPVGYYVPDDAYSVMLSNMTDTTEKAFFTVFKDSVVYAYTRGNVDPSQVDQFSVDEGFSVMSSDISEKNIDLKIIAERDSSERILYVRNAPLRQNDSLYLQQLGQNNFVLKNYGTAKSYDLEINERSSKGQEVFEHVSITLGENSSHTVEPDWDSLANRQLRILIDNGNNGTFDDSIVVNNEPTKVIDRKLTEIPKEYSLSQNYPNPFNPTTTIQYQLPEMNFVSLKVYDAIGREAAVLVNEVKEAGYYSIKFDASKLSTGVYIYTLRAGSYVASKKLLILK